MSDSDELALAALLEPVRLDAASGALYAAPIAFAAERHAGQLRKGTSLPYLVHPLEVGALLARDHPDRSALISAGFLHDTLEDTHTRLDELTAAFGPETARLVSAVTRRPWHRWRLDTGDRDVVRLKAADVASNLRATLVDLRRDGPRTWRRFRGGERVKRAYYVDIGRQIVGAIPGEPLAIRVARLTDLLDRS